MNRRQWGWIAAIGVALLFVLVTAKYAYDANAAGVRTSGLVNTLAWAVPVLAGLAGVLGVLGAMQESFTAFAIRLVNSLYARLAIIASSVALAVVFLIAALRVEPPTTWSCGIQSKRVVAPDRSRCGDGTFAQMRSFRLGLVRATDVEDLPALRVSVGDRALSSVSVDSDRGGLCVATGPDQPTRGESRLVLSTDCGADRLYVVNVHVCDTKTIEGVSHGAAELRAAVRLEIREGNHANVVECK